MNKSKILKEELFNPKMKADINATAMTISKKKRFELNSEIGILTGTQDAKIMKSSVYSLKSLNIQPTISTFKKMR
jgi:hypothetical protein